MRGSFHICRGGIDSLNMVVHTLESWYWRILGSTPFHPLILGWAHSRAVTSANETIILKLVFHWNYTFETSFSFLAKPNWDMPFFKFKYDSSSIHIQHDFSAVEVRSVGWFGYLPAAIRSDTSNQIGSDVDRPHMAHTTGGHFCFCHNMLWMTSEEVLHRGSPTCPLLPPLCPLGATISRFGRKPGCDDTHAEHPDTQLI